MSAATKILTDLQPDDALAQNSASFTASDRQFIDTQIRGCQQHLATLVLNGVHATYVKVDAGSATLAKGDVVCLGASALGYPTVKLANSAALAVAGSAFGVALLAAAPGSYALLAIGGLVGPSITGLAATAGVVRVSTAGRPERRASFAAGDYPLGTVDSTGYLTIARAAVVAAASGIGVAGSVDDVPAMASQPVARDSSGDAAFHALRAGASLRVGVAADGGTYAQFQNTTPSATRQFTNGTDGPEWHEADGNRKAARRWEHVTADSAIFVAKDMQIVSADNVTVSDYISLPSAIDVCPSVMVKVQSSSGAVVVAPASLDETIMDGGNYNQSAGEIAMYIGDGEGNYARFIAA